MEYKAETVKKNKPEPYSFRSDPIEKKMHIKCRCPCVI